MEPTLSKSSGNAWLDSLLLWLMQHAGLSEEWVTGVLQNLVASALVGLLGVGGLLFVGYRCWLTWRRRSHAFFRFPKADPKRFNIIIADLANDQKRVSTTRIRKTLNEHPGSVLKAEALGRVIITINDLGDRSEQIARGDQHARSWLERTGYDVLVWGEYDTGSTGEVLRLRFSSVVRATTGGRDNRDFSDFGLTRELTLPAAFDDKLATVLVATCLAYVQPASQDVLGHLIDVLGPVMGRVSALLDTGLPGVSSEAAHTLRTSAAWAATCLSEQTGDLKILNKALTWLDATSDGDKQVRAMAMNVRSVALATLSEHVGHPTALHDAVAACNAALEFYTHEDWPFDWAMTQSNLGTVLSRLGEQSDDGSTLRDAVSAFGAALTIYTREKWPLYWAKTQANLGTTLSVLGERSNDETALRDAVGAFTIALDVQTREKYPLDWARIQISRANVLVRLGERRGDEALLRDAIDAYRAALKIRSRGKLPIHWAYTQNNLGAALASLNRLTGDETAQRQAITAYKAALEVFSRDSQSLRWATLQNNLGNALSRLGEQTNNQTILREAIAAPKAALEVRSRSKTPFDWAVSHNNLGIALCHLGTRNTDKTTLREAIAAHRTSLEVLTREEQPLNWAMTQHGLGNALATFGKHNHDQAALRESVEAHKLALEIFDKTVPAYAQTARLGLARAESMLEEIR